MIKVSNEVTIYEINGEERSDMPPPILVVRSHWNHEQRVVLEIAGQRITVIASDLHAAINNATNTRRHG